MRVVQQLPTFPENVYKTSRTSPCELHKVLCVEMCTFAHFKEELRAQDQKHEVYLQAQLEENDAKGSNSDVDAPQEASHHGDGNVCRDDKHRDGDAPACYKDIKNAHALYRYRSNLKSMAVRPPPPTKGMDFRF